MPVSTLVNGGPRGRGWLHDDQHLIRHEGLVTSLSWIPSEAIEGAQRLGLRLRDHPLRPAAPIEDIDLEALRVADRFRFANELRAWIDGRRTGRSPTAATRAAA
jgi:hypothetical protein